jgi:hypothetical protein
MWTKRVDIDEKYDTIVSVLQSNETPFKEKIIDHVIGYDETDRASYNIRMLEYRDTKGNYQYWAETIFRYLDETKNDRIEAFLIPNPSDENSKGGWVTEWACTPTDTRMLRIPKKRVELETQDFIFSKCRMETNDIGTVFYGFTAEEFPEYAGKLYFMHSPLTYQDGLGKEKVENPIPIEAHNNKIEDEWVAANREKIKTLLEKLTTDKDSFYEFFKMIFDYAINTWNIYNLYAFGTKIIEDKDGNKKTVLYVRGCEKV